MIEMDFEYSETKFAELVLHLAACLSGDRAGGATKLNKALFFVEFTHVRRHGRPISACEFQKLEHGPAPRQLVPTRRTLIESGDAELVEQDFLGRAQHRLVAKRAADLSHFDDAERQTIADVVEALRGLTGRQVSDLSHEEPGWKLTDLGQTIPYSSALLGAEQVATAASTNLTQIVAERYGFPIAQ